MTIDIKLKSKIIIFFMFAFGFCKAQNFRHLDVYQYSGTDSTTRIIALQKVFNSRGQLVYEKKNGYLENLKDYAPSGEEYYFYSKKFVVLSKTINYLPGTLYKVFPTQG